VLRELLQQMSGVHDLLYQTSAALLLCLFMLWVMGKGSGK
jgi:hypothetical protein